jgi:hypothetical protein
LQLVGTLQHALPLADTPDGEIDPKPRLEIRISWNALAVLASPWKWRDDHDGERWRTVKFFRPQGMRPAEMSMWLKDWYPDVTAVGGLVAAMREPRRCAHATSDECPRHPPVSRPGLREVS